MLFVLSLGINSYAQEGHQFRPFNNDKQFIAITVDSFNKKIWASTDENATGQKGIFYLNTDVETLPSNFSQFSVNTTPDLGLIRIKDMAADTKGNIWIAHQGINSGGAQGGLMRINSNGNATPYSPDGNTLGRPFASVDGFAGRRLNSVHIDKNNRVWTVNRNHSFTSGSTFILTPGAISHKAEDETKFTTYGAWYDSNGNTNNLPTELPFPAFTRNPGPTDSPQSRNMQAISSDDSSVWVGCWSYVPKRDVNEFIPNRVLKYDLQGGSPQQYTYDQMGFAPGGIINNICANNSKGTWVTSSIGDRGFSVLEGNNWYNSNEEDFSKIIPEGARFNNNAVWKDKIGRVFIGTDKGLIVYNGFGLVEKQTSYKIYTNYSFEGPGGTVNELNVYDPVMLSSNIKAGASDPNDSNVSWIATDKGIMKLFLSPEGMRILHLKNHKDYDVDTPDEDDNLTHIALLRNEKLLASNQTIPDPEIPSIAADDSKATIFRFDNFDPQDFYATNSAYKLYLAPKNTNIPPFDIESENYKRTYGHFELKKLESYPGNPSPQELDYVEFIYEHPSYIKQSDYTVGENYAEFEFHLTNSELPNSDAILFKHPIKIALPSILMGHGVWSDINSFDEMKKYFKNNGFKDYMLLRAWRHNSKDAEKAFEDVAHIIPEYIGKLKNKAAENKFSVGRVNLVVHSRGGLYSRAYIEEVGSNLEYLDDVHSLITLNTPHSGSQPANLILDQRIVLTNKTRINTFISGAIDNLTSITPTDEGLTIGNIGSIAAPVDDRVEQWGAKNLLVEIDNNSQFPRLENPNFIKRLNDPINRQKLKEVPIHTISTTFDYCLINPILCNDLEKTNGVVTSVLPKQVKVFVKLYNLFVTITNDLPNGLDKLTKYLYNGEESDLIVPLSSMQAGLGNRRFNTTFPGLSIPHITIPVVGLGVTEAPEVLERIKQLLRSNINASFNGGTSDFFTIDGIYPDRLSYNFLPDFQGNFTNNPITSKILINRDPNIFDNRASGDELNFKVYVEDVDKIIVSYENENNEEAFSYEIRNSEGIQFTNDFTFTIPDNFYGKTTITAEGYKQGVLGYSSSTVTLNVTPPTGVTLQSIKFKQRDPIILNQSNFSFDLIGTYSDGIDRIINDLDGLNFSIEDTTIASQIDNNSIKAEMKGSTILSASINGLEDSILVTIEENPALFQTILTNFYGELNPDNSNVTVFWNTLREYENQTFVLQTSYGTPDSFIDIHEEAGNGTNPESSQFNYVDSSFGTNEIIFYRLKMIDTSGNETFSSVIQINRITLSTNSYDNESVKLKLFPNPNNTNNVTLTFKANYDDKNSNLEIYNLQGKKLYANNISVINGKNELDIKLPSNLSSGIYLVKVSTLGFIKSVKLVIE